MASAQHKHTGVTLAACKDVGGNFLGENLDKSAVHLHIIAVHRESRPSVSAISRKLQCPNLRLNAVVDRLCDCLGTAVGGDDFEEGVDAQLDVLTGLFGGASHQRGAESFEPSRRAKSLQTDKKTSSGCEHGVVWD